MRSDLRPLCPDEAYLAWIGDEHLVPHALQFLLNPGAVCADLKSDATGGATAEGAVDAGTGGGDLELFEDLT